MWGLALLLRPARAAPGAPFVCLPLCRSPNVCCNNPSGHLTRWSHVNLRAGRETTKLCLNAPACQAQLEWAPLFARDLYILFAKMVYDLSVNVVFELLDDKFLVADDALYEVTD